MPELYSHPLSVTIDGTAITGIRSLRIEPGARSELDRTYLHHTDYRRVGLGLRAPGSATIELTLNPNDPGQIALWNAYEQVPPAEHTFQVTWSDSTVEAFTARVRNFDRSANVDQDVVSTVTLQITSAVAGFA
jgi:hypothetical protein